MVIYINIFEGSNFKGMFAISSKYDIANDNAFIGLLGILTATKSNPSGDIFRVEAEVKAGFNAQPRFAFRFYDTRDETGIPDGKTLAQGGLKTDGIGFVKDIV